MAIVAIPSLMRDLTDGKDQISVEGETLRQIIDNLDQNYPGVKDRLVEVDRDRLNPHIAVYVGSDLAENGLRQKIPINAEIYFVPAVSGGKREILTLGEVIELTYNK